MSQSYQSIIAKVPKCLLPRTCEVETDWEGLCEIIIEHDGKRIESVKAMEATIPADAIDVRRSVLFPGFLDAHTHLDKTHSWERAPNVSGTFDEALRKLFEDKEYWTEEDVYRRANYGLECAYAHGTVALRSHVDTGLDWAERSYRALSQLRDDWAGKVELQLVSLCRVDDYNTSNGETLADLPVNYGANALGGMPLMNKELDTQLDRLMSLAREREVGLDLHVDESGNESADTLSAVARAVLRNEFEYPVVCGHCCSLAVKPVEEQRKVLQLVKEAGIQIVSLPMCNVYLQDRRGSADVVQTPYWRGITLAHEFLQQETPFACASDNVRDAFYAYGDYDMLEVFRESVRIGHLDRRIQEAPTIVSSHPANLMGLADRYFGHLVPGAPARFVTFPVESMSQLLSRSQLSRKLFVDGRFQTVEVPPFRSLI